MDKTGTHNQEKNPEDSVLALKGILARAARKYDAKDPAMDDRAFLEKYLKEELPDYSEEDCKKEAAELMDGIARTQKNFDSINEHCARGGRKETWVQQHILHAGAGVGEAQFNEYLSGIDEALEKSNLAMLETISNQQGGINQNPQLDGFMAETYHQNTFNNQAALQNSSVRAHVHVPDGRAYGKNSVDISINSDSGRVLQNYQAKYGKTAEATAHMVKKGDYRNQRILVPDGQETAVSQEMKTKTVTNRLEYDGISSKPLSKKQAKRMQEQVQADGRLKKYTMGNSFSNRELALHVGKQAAVAGLGAAAISSGLDLAYQWAQGEDVDSSEVIKAGITGGATAGAATAITGGLKVAAARGVLPKVFTGMTNSGLGAVAFASLEITKSFYKVGTGQMSLTQALETASRGTCAAVAGMAGSELASGLVLGLTAATGPLAAVIGLTAGVLGGLAGSKVGTVIHKAAVSVGKVAVSAVKTACKAVYKVGKTIAHGVKSVVSFVASLF
jgi:hypothetical protein